MRTLTTTNQARWKDSYASSARTGLTLRANGEDAVSVYTEDGQLVQAGFDAPATAPTATPGAGGALPNSACAYVYCYASTRYPKVEAIVTAGGELWPKGNPSPAVICTEGGASKKNTVVVTKTTRSDVDKILIYRTNLTTALALQNTVGSLAGAAQALADAGEYYFVAAIANDGIAGTTSYADNIADTALGEQIELDNYTCAQFQNVVYEAPYFYGFGNPELDVEVTLSNSALILAAAGTFYVGRNGQFATFDGITNGGFDGKGTFYFKYASDAVANVSVLSDLSAAATVAATGTTIMRVRGYGATLYRSKPNDPFGWGYTEYLNSPDGTSVVRVPQQFAYAVGGRGAAISVMGEQRLLKLDVENPSAAITLNLNAAGSPSDFFETKRLIDRQFVVSSQHSQFTVAFPNGLTGLCGIDAGNRMLVRADASNQSAFGDEVVATMGALVTTGDNARLVHGVYDPETELSCWWIKTADDPDGLLYIDTCVCYHGPSGQFSTFLDFDVTASASVYDPVTLETLILVGAASGQILRAFVSGVSDNACVISGSDLAPQDIVITPIQQQVGSLSATGATPSDPGPSFGEYFDIGAPDGTVRIWFSNSTLTTSPPAAPTNGRLARAAYASASITTGNAFTAIANAMAADGAFSAIGGSNFVDYTLVDDGPCPPFSQGTCSVALTNLVETAGSSGILFGTLATPVSELLGTLPFDGYSAGHWALVTDADGANEAWVKSNAIGAYSLAVVYDAATGTVGTSLPFASGHLWPGLINCEGQMYFQPSQTRAHQAREIWGTFRNHDTDGALLIRFYREFETNATGTAITPEQLTRQYDSSASMNWKAAADVNTELVNQMGYRLIERGYEAFEVLGLSIKNHST